MLGDHVLGHEAFAALPAFRRLVEHVEDLEALILAGQLVELVLDEDVALADVRVDQANLGLVGAAQLAALRPRHPYGLSIDARTMDCSVRLATSSTAHKHRRDPGSASKHANLGRQIGLVLHLHNQRAAARIQRTAPRGPLHESLSPTFSLAMCCEMLP